MLAKLIFLLCLVAAYAHAFEEIIPTRTVEVDKRADSGECQRFYAEVRAGKGSRRIGYLSIDGESHASLSRDSNAASVLHFDSKGYLRTKRSFLGLRNVGSTRGFSNLGLMKSKPKMPWTEDLTHGDTAFCYSRSQNVIYGHQKKFPPANFKCSPVTFEQKCVKGPAQPNPSDTVTKTTIKTRDGESRLWEAVRLNLAN